MVDTSEKKAQKAHWPKTIKTRIIFVHFQQFVLAPTIAEFARPDFWLRQTALTPICGARRRAQSPAEQYLNKNLSYF